MISNPVSSKSLILKRQPTISLENHKRIQGIVYDHPCMPRIMTVSSISQDGSPRRIMSDHHPPTTTAPVKSYGMQSSPPALIHGNAIITQRQCIGDEFTTGNINHPVTNSTIHNREHASPAMTAGVKRTYSYPLAQQQSYPDHDEAYRTAKRRTMSCPTNEISQRRGDYIELVNSRPSPTKHSNDNHNHQMRSPEKKSQDYCSRLLSPSNHHRIIRPTMASFNHQSALPQRLICNDSYPTSSHVCSSAHNLYHHEHAHDQQNDLIVKHRHPPPHQHQGSRRNSTGSSQNYNGNPPGTEHRWNVHRYKDVNRDRGKRHLSKESANTSPSLIRSYLVSNNNPVSYHRCDAKEPACSPPPFYVPPPPSHAPPPPSYAPPPPPPSYAPPSQLYSLTPRNSHMHPNQHRRYSESNTANNFWMRSPPPLNPIVSSNNDHLLNNTRRCVSQSDVVRHAHHVPTSCERFSIVTPPTPPALTRVVQYEHVPHRNGVSESNVTSDHVNHEQITRAMPTVDSLRKTSNEEKGNEVKVERDIFVISDSEDEEEENGDVFVTIEKQENRKRQCLAEPETRPKKNIDIDIDIKQEENNIPKEYSNHSTLSRPVAIKEILRKKTITKDISSETGEGFDDVTYDENNNCVATKKERKLDPCCDTTMVSDPKIPEPRNETSPKREISGDLFSPDGRKAELNIQRLRLSSEDHQLNGTSINQTQKPEHAHCPSCDCPRNGKRNQINGKPFKKPTGIVVGIKKEDRVEKEVTYKDTLPEEISQENKKTHIFGQEMMKNEKQTLFCEIEEKFTDEGMISSQKWEECLARCTPTSNNLTGCNEWRAPDNGVTKVIVVAELRKRQLKNRAFLSATSRRKKINKDIEETTDSTIGSDDDFEQILLNMLNSMDLTKETIKVTQATQTQPTSEKVVDIRTPIIKMNKIKTEETFAPTMNSSTSQLKEDGERKENLTPDEWKNILLGRIEQVKQSIEEEETPWKNKNKKKVLEKLEHQLTLWDEDASFIPKKLQFFQTVRHQYELMKKIGAQRKKTDMKKKTENAVSRNKTLKFHEVDEKTKSKKVKNESSKKSLALKKTVKVTESRMAVPVDSGVDL